MGAGAIAHNACRPRHQRPAQRTDYARWFVRRDLPRVAGGRFTLITSNDQIEELRRASRYAKFRTVLQPHKVGKLINNLQQAIVLDRLPPAENEGDPFDAFLLAMVEAGGADWLVTGDKRVGLLERGRYGGARIVTPGVFLGVLGIE